MLFTGDSGAVSGIPALRDNAAGLRKPGAAGGPMQYARAPYINGIAAGGEGELRNFPIC